MTLPALHLAWHDFRILLRRKSTLLWAFLMPVIFFSFIGKVTSGFGGDPDQKDRLALFIPPQAGFLAGELERRLAAVGYDVRRVEQEAEAVRYSRLIRVPEDFTAALLARRPQKVVLTVASSGLGAEFDNIRFQRAVYGLLGEVIAAQRDGNAATPERLQQISGQPSALQIELKAAGKRRDPPTGYQQSVPGSMVMFTLLVMLTSGSVSLVVERKAGILRRLASSPLSRGEVALAKWLSRLGLGIIQIAFAALVGTLLFSIEWGSAWPAIALLLLCYAGLCAMLSLLLGSLARSEGQAVGYGAVAGNLLAALGGCWWPVEITPAWMQKLALAMPPGLAMDGLHRLMSFAMPPTAVLWHCVVLAAAAAAAAWLTARAFRFQ